MKISLTVVDTASYHSHTDMARPDCDAVSVKTWKRICEQVKDPNRKWSARWLIKNHKILGGNEDHGQSTCP